MRTDAGLMNNLSLIVKKALDGRVSPFNFLLLLGFISSVVLLYISLHVHFSTLSANISYGFQQREDLRDQKNFLTAEYNRLISPERIIPLALEDGLKAGSPGEISRLAFYENADQMLKPASGWAQVYSIDVGEDKLSRSPDNR